MLSVTEYYPQALSGEFGTASAVRGWSQALAAAGAHVRLIVDRQFMRLPSPEVCEASYAMGEEFLTDQAGLGELEFDSIARKLDDSYKN